MTKFLLAAAVAAAGLCTLANGPAEAQSTRLEMNQVPPHILAAARAVGRLADVTEVGAEVECARVIYEIKGRGRGGRVREVDFLLSGELEEIEEEVQRNDVPQPVMQAQQRWSPNFRPTKFERSERPMGGGLMAVYELEGQLGGVEAGIEVAADGSRLMIVDDSRG